MCNRNFLYYSCARNDNTLWLRIVIHVSAQICFVARTSLIRVNLFVGGSEYVLHMHLSTRMLCRGACVAACESELVRGLHYPNQTNLVPM